MSIVRSKETAGVKTASSPLLPATVSVSVVATTAVLVIAPVRSLSRSTSKVNVTAPAAPGAMSGRVNVRLSRSSPSLSSPPSWATVTPSVVCRLPSKTTPSGSWSVTVTPRAVDGPLLTTVMLNCIPSPAMAVPTADFVIARSTLRATLLSAESVSLAVLVSVSGVRFTVAALENRSSLSTSTSVTIVMTAESPLSRSPMLIRSSRSLPLLFGFCRIRLLLSPVCPGSVTVPLTNVTSSGRTSSTNTPSASSGPSLVTVIVYVSCSPAVTGSGEASLTIRRSVSRKSTDTVDVLFAASVSNCSSVATVAVLSTSAVWFAATSATIWKVSEASAARLPTVTLTFWPVPVRVSGVLRNSLNVRPAGSTSLTSTAVASSGPLFWTVMSNTTVPPGAITESAATTLLVICRSTWGSNPKSTVVLPFSSSSTPSPSGSSSSSSSSVGSACDTNVMASVTNDPPARKNPLSSRLTLSSGSGVGSFPVLVVYPNSGPLGLALPVLSTNWPAGMTTR